MDNSRHEPLDNIACCTQATSLTLFSLTPNARGYVELTSQHENHNEKRRPQRGRRVREGRRTAHAHTHAQPREPIRTTDKSKISRRSTDREGKNICTQLKKLEISESRSHVFGTGCERSDNHRVASVSCWNKHTAQQQQQRYDICSATPDTSGREVPEPHVSLSHPETLHPTLDPTDLENKRVNTSTK